MHRDIEYFIKTHLTANEEIVAYETDLQKILILTNHRVTALEKKVLSIQLTSINYSEVTGVEQKFTQLIVFSPSTEIHFSGATVSFLSKAIQRIKSDQDAYKKVQEEFETLLNSTNSSKKSKFTLKKAVILFLALPAFIAIMADFLSKQKEQIASKKITMRAIKTNPLEEYKEQIFDDCLIFTTRTYPQAKITILGPKDIRPRKNTKGNWVTAISWKATNAFGVDVYNRTWCEFEGDSRKIIAEETETLKLSQ